MQYRLKQDEAARGSVPQEAPALESDGAGRGPETRGLVSAHYAGTAGAEYVSARQADAGHVGYRLNLEYFLPYLSREHRVLDFGCGNGGMLRLLPEHTASAAGLEVNPHARVLAQGSGLQVYASLEELPVAEFDVIISNHVLEHVRDVPATLEQLARALKPSGQLLLKLPLEDWRAAGQRTWDARDIDHHLHTWTPRLLANTLKEGGFRTLECRVITSAWHPRLFPLIPLGLGKLAFWALAAVLKRRQLFAVAVPNREAAST